MPKPVFMICSESASEDKTTGAFSLFNIVDALEFKGPLGGSFSPLPILVTAVWQQSDEDEPQQYDFKLVGFMPVGPEAEEKQLIAGSFEFNKPRFRITVRLHNFTPKKAGTYHFVNSIRRQGETGEWLSQAYDFNVNLIEIPPSPA